MTYVKLDDGFFRHPKALAAGRDGRDLFLASCCWASANLTDGHVPASVLPQIALDAGVKPAAAARLVEVGLWEPNGDGWLIHDYLDRNRSREQVESLRQRWARNQSRRRGGDQ